MIDTTEVANKILTEGGLLGALLLLSVSGNLFLSRRLLASEAARVKEGKECADAQEASFEKRIEECQRMTLALERTAATSLTLTTSSEALVKLLGTMVEARRHEHETLTRIEQALQTLRDRCGQRQAGPA